MKNKVMIVLLCIVVLLTSACATNASKKDNKDNKTKLTETAELMEKSEILDWNNVYSIISKDKTKISEYNGKYYIYSGIISSVDKENNVIVLTSMISKYGKPHSTDDVINVHVSSINNFNLNECDLLNVVGKLNITGNMYDLEDAKVITKEDIDLNKYYLADIRYNEFNFYKVDYKINESTGMPASYTVIGSSKMGYDYILNKTMHQFTYDDNNNVITERVIDYDNENLVDDYTITYEYDEYNDVILSNQVRNNDEKTLLYSKSYDYERNDKNLIVKKIENVTGADKRTNETTYEYNDKKQIIKEITNSSVFDSTTINTYEYNENNDIIKETSRDSFTNSYHTYNYIYDDLLHVKREDENRLIHDYIQYGIIGKKK